MAKAAESPGPNQYQDASEFRPRGPVFSLSGKHWPEAKVNEVPGAGAYDPDFEAVSVSAPAFTLKSSRSCPAAQGQQTPGPGAYDVAVRESGPKITLGSRWGDKSQV